MEYISASWISEDRRKKENLKTFSAGGCSDAKAKDI